MNVSISYVEDSALESLATHGIPLILLPLRLSVTEILLSEALNKAGIAILLFSKWHRVDAPQPS